MNTRKNQNSILFLTTLGVYLGLVLVGATPKVVAQRAAMARSFDVTDEVEFKDELLKNPEGCDNLEAVADGKLHPLWFHDDALSQYADILGDLARLLKRSGEVNFEYASASDFSNENPDRVYGSFAEDSRPVLYNGRTRIEIEKAAQQLFSLFTRSIKRPDRRFTFEFASGSEVSAGVTLTRSDDYDALKV